MKCIFFTSIMLWFIIFFSPICLNCDFETSFLLQKELRNWTVRSQWLHVVEIYNHHGQFAFSTPFLINQTLLDLSLLHLINQMWHHFFMFFFFNSLFFVMSFKNLYFFCVSTIYALKKPHQTFPVGETWSIDLHISFNEFWLWDNCIMNY